MFYLQPEDQQPGVVSHNPDLVKLNILGNGVIPHLTGFSRVEFPAGKTAAAHSHQDMVELFWVESGSGSITVDGKEFELGPGICIAVHPGETHEVRSAPDQKLTLLYFGVRA